jgi:hypothetical protein
VRVMGGRTCREHQQQEQSSLNVSHSVIIQPVVAY